MFYEVITVDVQELWVSFLSTLVWMVSSFVITDRVSQESKNHSIFYAMSSTSFSHQISHFVFVVQVRLGTEVLSTPSLSRLGFELVTSSS